MENFLVISITIIIFISILFYYLYYEYIHMYDCIQKTSKGHSKYFDNVTFKKRGRHGRCLFHKCTVIENENCGTHKKILCTENNEFYLNPCHASANCVFRNDDEFSPLPNPKPANQQFCRQMTREELLTSNTIGGGELVLNGPSGGFSLSYSRD